MEACRNPLLNDMPESRNENHHIPGPNPNTGPATGPSTTGGGSKRSKSKWQDGKHPSCVYPARERLEPFNQTV
jgi:hypothetical protein